MARELRLVAWIVCLVFAAAAPWALAADAVAAAGAAEEGNPTLSERWLPADTLAVVRVPNVPEFRARWKESAFGAMEEDPEFADFVADVREQLDKWSGGLQRALGVDLLELWQATQGELSVALVQRSDQQLALLALVDLGDNREAVAGTMRRMEDKLEGEGAERLTIQAGEQDVTSWTGQLQGKKQSFSYLLRDGELVLSDSVPALVETLARVERGSEAGFSSNEKYRHVMDEAQPTGASGVVEWYSDPIGLVNGLLAPNLQGKPQERMIGRFLESSGLGQLEAVGGSINLAAGPFDSVSRTVGYVPEPTRGLLKAFALDASPQRPPDWVPDDVALYSQINWSLPRAYSAVAGFYDSLSGEGAFDEAVGSMGLGETSLNLKRDLIDPLVGPVHIVADVPESFEGAMDQPVAFSIGVRDAQRFEETVGELARSAGAEPRDIEGTTLHELRLPSVLPGQTTRLGVALAEGNLMISTKAGYLEQILRDRGRKRPLAESLAYRRVADQFPAKTAMISYQRQDRDFRSLYEAVRSGTLLPALPGIAAPLDFGKLPPFQAISRYLQTTGSYIEPTPTGFRMVDFALPPREQ